MHTRTIALADARWGLLLITFAAISWGTVGIASNAIYELLGNRSFALSLSIGFLRLAFSLPALALLSWTLLGPRTWQVARADLPWIGLIGVAMAGYQVSYFAAVAQVGVTIAVLVALCSAPVIVALLSALLLREPLAGRVLLALGAALAGTVLLVGLPADMAAQRRMLLGTLLALGAALSYAIVALCSRTLAGHYHPLQSITLGFGVGALLLLPCALLAGLVMNYPVSGWAWLLHLGLIPTALGYLLFFTGMRHTTATAASITTLLEPLTSALLAWWLFDERLGSLGLLGGTLLLGAMLLLYLPARR
ncbi:MAG: DMT family transporter [Chloroflexaceae bacterium]